MRVEITRSAQRDLWAIVDWLAKEASPETASQVYEALTADCLALVPMPRRFPFVEGSRHRNLRFRVSGDYVILYVVQADVHVLRVVHSARDYLRFV